MMRQQSNGPTSTTDNQFMLESIDISATPYRHLNDDDFVFVETEESFCDDDSFDHCSLLSTDNLSYCSDLLLGDGPDSFDPESGGDTTSYRSFPTTPPSLELPDVQEDSVLPQESVVGMSVSSTVKNADDVQGVDQINPHEANGPTNVPTIHVEAIHDDMKEKNNHNKVIESTTTPRRGDTDDKPNDTENDTTSNTIADSHNQVVKTPPMPPPSKSRKSNKKRRKALMRKAAAAMRLTSSPSASSPPRQRCEPKRIPQKKLRSKQRVSNIAVACATESLAAFRLEVEGNKRNNGKKGSGNVDNRKSFRTNRTFLS